MVAGPDSPTEKPVKHQVVAGHESLSISVWLWFGRLPRCGPEHPSRPNENLFCTEETSIHRAQGLLKCLGEEVAEIILTSQDSF